MFLTKTDNIPFGVRRGNAWLPSPKKGWHWDWCKKKALHKWFSRVTTKRSPRNGSI